MGDFLSRLNIERDQDWRGWIEKIPSIKIPDNVRIRIVPPFGGAVARFLLEKFDSKENLSVYLDCFQELGYYSGPYWEAYPWNGDIMRFAIDDVAGLEKLLKEWSEK